MNWSFCFCQSLPTSLQWIFHAKVTFPDNLNVIRRWFNKTMTLRKDLARAKPRTHWSEPGPRPLLGWQRKLLFTVVAAEFALRFVLWRLTKFSRTWRRPGTTCCTNSTDWKITARPTSNNYSHIFLRPSTCRYVLDNGYDQMRCLLYWITLCPALAKLCPALTKRCPAFTKLCPALAKLCPALAKLFPAFTKLCPAFTKRCPAFTKRCPALTKLCPALTKRCPALTKRCPALTKLFPALTKLFPALTKLFPALTKLFPALAKLCPALAKLCPALAKLCPALTKLCPALTKLCPALTKLCPALAKLFPAFTKLCPALSKLNHRWPNFAGWTRRSTVEDRAQVNDPGAKGLGQFGDGFTHSWARAQVTEASFFYLWALFEAELATASWFSCLLWHNKISRLQPKATKSVARFGVSARTWRKVKNC